MAIITPMPSSQIEALAKSSLVHLSAHAFGHSEVALEQVRSSVRVSDPLQVFYLGLRSAVGEPSLTGAELVAWRFFILRGNRAVASTEIGVNARGGSPRWSYISYDPRIQTCLSVVRRARANPQYEDVSYELRFLRVPALDQNALLWLAPAETDDSILIPMGSQSLLRAGWPYSLQKWFKAVQSHARSRLSSSSIRETAGET